MRIRRPTKARIKYADSRGLRATVKFRLRFQTLHLRLQWARSQLHFQPTARSQRDHRIELHHRMWQEIQSIALDDFREDDLRFHHRERIADADARAEIGRASCRERV